MSEGLTPNPEAGEKLAEQVVVLLKPGHADKIERLVKYLEKKGLKILDQQTVTLNEDIARNFYPHAEGAIKEMFGSKEGEAKMREFIEYLSSDEVMALLVEGEDSIEIVSRLKDKVRAWFELQKPEDAIHASSDIEEAQREAAVLGLGNPR